MHFKRLDLQRALLATLSLLVSAATAVSVADTPTRSPTAAEPGWQRVVARKGGCVMYVPADWKVDPVVKAAAGLADRSASAVISLADSVSTLAAVKPVMESNFKPDKTFEDSAQRLWYEYRLNARINFYVGVPVKGGVCGAQISFKPEKEAIGKKIAASVGAG